MFSLAHRAYSLFYIFPKFFVYIYTALQKCKQVFFELVLNPSKPNKYTLRGYKTFMLNSAEHEILNAHKYKNIKKLSIFQAHISLECYFSCS